MSNLKRSDRLLIIIPAYNEQGAINHVVSGVRKAVPFADVLVINDGSVDNTAQEAEAAGALVVEHPFNLGIGGAVQTGLKFARDQGYDYVIRLDGDGQHNTDEIQLFLSVLRGGRTDMVVGSRFLDADVDWHIPFARRVGINFFGWAVSILIGKRATDTTSGFCGMNRQAIEVLATYLPQDYPDVESRVIVHKAGLRQMELPVRMRARMAGVSSINSWKSIYYAFKVSLAMITSALKDIHLHNHSPYINGNNSVNGIDHNGYQNGSHHSSSNQNGVTQNGHYTHPVMTNNATVGTANSIATNGTPVGAANSVATNGTKSNGVHENGIHEAGFVAHVVTPNGADVVQPSGVES